LSFPGLERTKRIIIFKTIFRYETLQSLIEHLSLPHSVVRFLAVLADIRPLRIIDKDKHTSLPYMLFFSLDEIERSIEEMQGNNYFLGPML